MVIVRVTPRCRPRAAPARPAAKRLPTGATEPPNEKESPAANRRLFPKGTDP